LGSKTKDVESFVDQLKSEGERVASANASLSGVNKPSGITAGSQHSPDTESVHLKIDETISLTAGKGWRFAKYGSTWNMHSSSSR